MVVDRTNKENSILTCGDVTDWGGNKNLTENMEWIVEHNLHECNSMNTCEGSGTGSVGPPQSQEGHPEKRASKHSSASSSGPQFPYVYAEENSCLEGLWRGQRSCTEGVWHAVHSVCFSAVQ